MTDTLDQPTGEQEPHDIARLRERAESATAAEKRAMEAERKLAVLESGIDTSHPMTKFFVDHYEGDIADTATLQDKAKELGIPFKGETEEVSQPSEQPIGGPVNLEPTGTEQRRALAGEDPNLGEVSPDPRKVALEASEEAMDKGATFEQAGGNYISSLVRAQKAGDTRVIIQERGPNQVWQPDAGSAPSIR